MAGLKVCGKQTSMVVERPGIPAFLLRQTMTIRQVAVWSQGSTNGRLNPMVTTASQQLPVKRGQLINCACISARFRAPLS